MTRWARRGGRMLLQRHLQFPPRKTAATCCTASTKTAAALHTTHRQPSASRSWIGGTRCSVLARLLVPGRCCLATVP